MKDIAAALLDAQLVLADLTSIPDRRCERWLARDGIEPLLDSGTVERLGWVLRSASARSGVSLPLPADLVLALESEVPVLPIPLYWTAYGQTQVRGAELAAELAAVLLDRVEGGFLFLGVDGWRPLDEGPLGRRSGLSRTRRLGYSTHVAAGWYRARHGRAFTDSVGRMTKKRGWVLVRVVLLLGFTAVRVAGSGHGAVWAEWCAAAGLEDVYYDWSHLEIWADEWGLQPTKQRAQRTIDNIRVDHILGCVQRTKARAQHGVTHQRRAIRRGG